MPTYPNNILYASLIYQDREIRELIWTPEDYQVSTGNGSFYINDIVIAKLKAPLVLNKHVWAVRLPSHDRFAEMETIEKCVVSGWGSNGE